MPTIPKDEEPQTLGDVLARMKPLPAPPPWADDDAHARTQRHNAALAQLQDKALVARHPAQNTIARSVPFPDGLLHFVPGRQLGPLAAARAGVTSNPWTDPSSIGSSNDTADPWASYAKSAVAAAGNNPPIAPTRLPKDKELGAEGWYTTESPVDLDVAREQPETGLAAAEKWVREPYSVGFTTRNKWLDQRIGSGRVEKGILDIVNRRTGEHRYVYQASKPGEDIAPSTFALSPDEEILLNEHSHPYAWSLPNTPSLFPLTGRGQSAADEAYARDVRLTGASGAYHAVYAARPDGKHEYLYYGPKTGLPPWR